MEHATGPLLAASAVLPWPRLGWIPLPAALYTSPLRSWLKSQTSSPHGFGTMLVAAAFLLLGVGFWTSLRAAPPAPRKETPASPVS